MHSFAVSTPIDDPGLWPVGAPVLSDPSGPELACDQQHARMFELSHNYGPLIGLTLCAGLAFSGFALDYRLAGFAVLVSLFWLYPPLLRRTGRHRLLSLCSLHHLMLVILWASHGYGGLTSPFLLWFAVVPLLGFLYLPPHLGLWLGLLLSMTGHMAAFVAFSSWFVPPPPMPTEVLQSLALLSIIGASAYVAMMAGYFGQLLSSRRELQQQADGHRAMTARLTRIADGIQQSSQDKLSMIRRLAGEAGHPLETMLRSSASLVSTAQPEDDCEEARSVADAVDYLRALIADTDRYAQLDGGAVQPRVVELDVLALLEDAAQHIRPWLNEKAEVRVRRSPSEDGLVELDGRLLLEAINCIGRHLALGAPRDSIQLQAERMVTANVEHLVIDLSRDGAGGLAERAAMIVDSQTLEAPSSTQHSGGHALSLSLAHRICALLGGNLLAAGAPADSGYFRILVPVHHSKAVREP